MRVAVCVITYRRPEGLGRLLDALRKLTFSKSDPTSLEVVVVDNDVAGTACTVCEDMAAGFRWPLRCCVEPRRGIPYARNTAIASARDANFVAFVDDDEVPEPSWLDELLRVQRAYDADVVAGPALPYFEGRVPDWVVRGKFFKRARFPTGFSPEPAYFATNNVLIRSGVFEEMGGAFDERFALSGGSDTHLFMRMRKAGYKMVWANEAVVHDRIPASRANARWLLQRSYRFGNTLALCERELEPSISVRALRIAKGGKQIAQGLLMVPPSVVLGRHTLIRALWRVCRGAGMLAGMFGVRYEEYRKTHGA